MIGTSYAVDTSFLDSLNIKSRNTASHIIHNEKLAMMIHYLKDIDPLCQAYGIPDKFSAKTILKACILTKVTYFDPEALTDQKIRLICTIVAKLLGSKSIEPRHIASITSTNHPILSRWMRTVSTKNNLLSQ